MKLRDFYPSLDALCEDMNVEKEVIVRTLKRVGFEYNPGHAEPHIGTVTHGGPAGAVEHGGANI